MVDVLAVLIGIPYLLYTPSLSDKILNGVKSCGRCFSRSQNYLVCVILTFLECKYNQWSNVLWSML